MKCIYGVQGNRAEKLLIYSKFGGDVIACGDVYYYRSCADGKQLAAGLQGMIL